MALAGSSSAACHATIPATAHARLQVAQGTHAVDQHQVVTAQVACSQLQLQVVVGSVGSGHQEQPRVGDIQTMEEAAVVYWILQDGLARECLLSKSQAASATHEVYGSPFW